MECESYCVYIVAVDPALVCKYLKQLLRLNKATHLNVLKLVGVAYGPKDDILIAYPYFSEHNLLSYLRKLRLESKKVRFIMQVITKHTSMYIL